jgi:hypothetical protein
VGRAHVAEAVVPAASAQAVVAEEKFESYGDCDADYKLPLVLGWAVRSYEAKFFHDAFYVLALRPADFFT